MSAEPRLFRIDPDNRESEAVTEVDFEQLGLRERGDIQEWVAANPRILGDDLLIVGKEFSGFDRTNERLDLLAVDGAGRLVVIELKRDDSGTDVHWQAIKYASYLQRASASDIVKLAAEYYSCAPEEAELLLLQHLGADDLNALNHDQRIILASHRFAPEVTSAALWLNRKAPGEDLITCVALTPYRDAMTGTLYVQASTLIPVPGIDDYVITIGESAQPGKGAMPSTLGAKLRATFSQNINDEVTPFLRIVGYDGITRAVELTSQTAVWYRSGKPPVLIRWVLIRDPQGSFATQALLCTDPAADPTQILEWFVLRWQLEVTFHEVRTHLGVETQRQWSDLAIARTTPALLGLFSWTTLAAHALQKRHPMTQRKAAWYDKPSPTFVDAIALARRHLWLASEGFSLSVADPDIQELPVALYHRLVDSLAYAA